MKERTDVSRFGGSEYQSGSVVLNFLKTREKLFRATSQEGVTVIQSRQNKGTDESFSSVFREVVTNGADSTEFKIACAANRGDVLIK